MNARVQPDRFATPDFRTEDDFSLPGWTYWDPEFFELERQVIFRKSWHLVCHVNDVANPGDFLTFKFLNDSVLVVRGPDAVVRSFHNVCRHRAARLVGAEQGNCGKRITCPYHAWTYATDGRLVGVPLRAGYPGMNANDYGLAEVELEIWRGFVFVRFAPGLPSVADQMAPYAAELADAPLEELVALGPPRVQTRHVNWKNVADNYSDGLHIPVAHPGLSRVFGKSYAIEARDWVDKMSGQLVDQPSSVPSERMYHKLITDLGLAGNATWAYYKLWPNAALEVYPDQIDVMQFIPVTATETQLRYVNYGLPDDRREMKAARYLNWRINRLVNLEDKDLIERVQAGMASSSYTVGPLGEGEVCLRSFGRRMRALFPEVREGSPPPKGWSVNRKAPRPQ